MLNLQNQKVLVASGINIFDCNNKMLPKGVHNFIINNITDQTIKGRINDLDCVSFYEFDFTQFIKLLMQGQKNLANKGNILFDSSIFRNNVTIPDSNSIDTQPVELHVCPICLNNCYNRRTITRCGHSFHMHCITHWIRRGQNTCPTCRASLTEQI